ARPVRDGRDPEDSPVHWAAGRPRRSEERFAQEQAMNILGKLDWSAIPLDQPIPLVASAVIGLAIVGTLAFVFAKGWFPYLWHEWLTSVDHKRIGVMYIVLACLMLLRGFADAIM